MQLPVDLALQARALQGPPGTLGSQRRKYHKRKALIILIAYLGLYLA